MLSACLALALGLVGPARAFSQALPPLKGECLSGRQAELPAEALGSVAVIVMSFSRNASDPAIRWGRALESEFKSPGDPLVYQVALLESAPRFVRPMILRSIRKKIGPAIQDRFVILVSGTDAWKLSAGYDKDFPDEAYLLVLNRKGEISWSLRSQGPEKDLKALKEKCAALSDEVQ